MRRRAAHVAAAHAARRALAQKSPHRPHRQPPATLPRARGAGWGRTGSRHEVCRSWRHAELPTAVTPQRAHAAGQSPGLPIGRGGLARSQGPNRAPPGAHYPRARGSHGVSTSAIALLVRVRRAGRRRKRRASRGKGSARRVERGRPQHRRLRCPPTTRARPPGGLWLPMPASTPPGGLSGIRA